MHVQIATSTNNKKARMFSPLKFVIVR